MAIADMQARNAKAKKVPYKLSDGEGMYLLVQPNGSKYRRLKYRVAGKEKVLALGVYPETSLTVARKRRTAAREQVAGGCRPMIEKKAVKRATQLRAANTFGAVALEWWESQCAAWSSAHSEAVKMRIDRELAPALGGRPAAEISAPAKCWM